MLTEFLNHRGTRGFLFFAAGIEAMHGDCCAILYTSRSFKILKKSRANPDIHQDGELFELG